MRIGGIPICVWLFGKFVEFHVFSSRRQSDFLVNRGFFPFPLLPLLLFLFACVIFIIERRGEAAK